MKVGSLYFLYKKHHYGLELSAVWIVVQDTDGRDEAVLWLFKKCLKMAPS